MNNDHEGGYMISLYMICVLLLICIMPVHTYYLADTLDATTTITRELAKYKERKLIEAVIAVESNFNTNAVSSKGALGLGQIMASVWHKELVSAGIIKTYADYFQIENNIAATDYILAKYRKTSKNLDIALMKYSGNAKGYTKKVKKFMNR